MAQLANDKCKFLGNVFSGSAPDNYKTYWNQVTPENAGKWGSTENTRDVMDWTGLDDAYNYALDNNFPFKQHTLVWGQQQPAWISSLSAEQQKEEVEEWIRAFCERYPQTDFIDVVNEPLHAVPGYSGALGGNGTSGWDWVIWAFEKAREYCPNAKLILNDYNILSSDEATNNYLKIINILKEKQLIDIIGEQGHFLETTPESTIRKNLNKLYATGLPIHISEYDVNLADDNAQAEKFKEQFSLFWSHPGVYGITLWGYRQGQIWRENAYLLRTNGTERPALTWLKSYVPGAAGGDNCNPVTGMFDERSDMEVYPNPVTGGRFTLKLGRGDFEVRVRDMQGKLRKEINVAGAQPVVVQLFEPAGLYLLEVFDGTHIAYRKIIIN